MFLKENLLGSVNYMDRNINIVNGICVTDKNRFKGNIEIRDGRITNILANEEHVDSRFETIDAAGCFILPGMIDTHVHIRGGEFSYREDFYSGSEAAVSAGITTILEMPGCAKPAYNEENFLKRVYEVKTEGAINFGLYGAAGFDNIDEIPKLANWGAIGFKTFQMAPVKGREKEFYGMCAETYEDMVSIMEAVKKTGRTLTVHCESQDIIDSLVPLMKEKYKEELKGFILSRPEKAESESVMLTVKAAKVTGCRTIIAHVSCPESIEIIKVARAEGYEIYAEICAHYLYFDMDEMNDFGPFGRMKPPFRNREKVDKMVSIYSDDGFDVTGSDHAPYTIDEKKKNGNDVWNSVDGLYGLEMTLPLLLNLEARGKISLENIASSFSKKAADIFRLQGKGRIEKGYDGDLCIVRKLNEPFILKKEMLRCKCKDAAVIYDGIPLEYEIKTTIMGGTVVYDGCQVNLKKGEARILYPY